MRLILTALLLLTTTAQAETLVIGNKGEDSVSFVDLATGRERAKVATAHLPHEAAVSPDGRQVAVVAYGGNSIDLFDVATATRVERIDLGTNTRPHGLAWLPDGRILAICEGSGTLAIVAPGSPRAVTAIATEQQGSHMLAVSPDHARVYVSNMKSGTVTVLDLAAGTKLRDLPAGAEPEGIALSPDGRRLWVADRQSGTVRVIDTRDWRELARLRAGKVPIRIAITPDGRRALVSNFGDGTLSLFDARTLKPAGTLPLSADPAAQQVTILLSPDGRRLYAAETGRNVIAEVDLARARVLRRLPAGRMGDGLAISPR